MSRPTPSQTVGPYFHGVLVGPYFRGTGAVAGNELVAADDPDAVAIHGVVRDGAGAPVDNGMVEIWVADAAGAYGEGSMGRVPTGPAGDYRVRVRTPGAVPGADGTPQQPHALLAFFSPGLVRQVLTRVYFAGAEIAADPVLSALPAEQSARLLGVADDAGLRFDITLQGAEQTPFFEI